MKRLLLITLLLFCISKGAFGEEPKKAEITAPKKPNTITLTVDEAKALKLAFDSAKQAQADAQAAQDRSAARTAEARALYFQFANAHKVDLDRFDPSTDQDGNLIWVEKTQPAKTEEKKDNGTTSKPN